MSQRTRNVKRTIALAAATLAAVLGPAAVSQASTASTAAGTLTFTATPGFDNDVTVADSAGYVISDPAEPVTAGAGCSQTTANFVTCTTPGVNSIRLNLDDGNDSTTVTSNQNVVIYGGAGNDTLRGGAQGDQLYGEDGNDSLNGGLGPDLQDGGNDFDSVTYAGRTNAVRVDLDGGWDDGEVTGVFPFTGEFDNVMPNVEEVTGGSGNDNFIGSPGANVFHGGDGADTMNGAAGDDTLYGDDGNDTLDGGYGTDTVDGGLADDSLMTRDSGVLDHVTCGDGADSLVADREDDVAAGCESVDVPAAAPEPVTPPADPTPDPTPTPTPAPTPAPKVEDTAARVVTVVERALTISTAGRIPVKIACGPEQAHDCRGTISITASLPKGKPGASRRSGPAKGSNIVVAKGKFKVKRGKTALASVKTSKKALKKAFGPKAKRVNATLTVSMKNSDGSTTQILKPISLSTKKKKA
jgi:hemolysin type calcium-binding protein